MGKRLKLGFAMGGGVSLGTFSGAALAETIKQCVAYGKYTDNNGEEVNYDSVEIDVFSGASAGSMSLAIMLRTLAHPLPEFIPQATENVKKEFPEFSTWSDSKQKDIIAAEVVKLVQEKIWVHEISLDKLLSGDNLKYKASLLNRDAVEDIAKKYFNLQSVLSAKDFNFSNKRILANRVIFGSTLSNLTPITYDARKEYSDLDINNPGLEDGFTSSEFKEMRIFDLHFYDINSQQNLNVGKLKLDDGFPERWVRYHLGEEKDGVIGELKTQKAWSKIVATSIACGGFPLAFEPVVLKRKKYEYPKSVWPKELEEQNRTEYPFTYVDGGTFNNEPIREAFKMASFLDAKEDNRNFDRRIIFVDPIVGGKSKNFELKIHKQYGYDDASMLDLGNKFDFKQLNTLNRLAPQVASLFGMIFHQARSNENNKIFASFQKFDHRNKARNIISSFFNQISPEDELIQNLIHSIQTDLNSSIKDELIPTGNLSIKGELQKIIVEECKDYGDLLYQIEDFLKLQSPSKSPHAKDWLKLLMFLKLDQLMQVSRKRENAKLIAIAPIKLNAKGNIEKIDLPGGLVEAFGGFTSPIPGIYEVKLAKWCVEFMLQQEGVNLIPHKELTDYEDFNDWENYNKDLQQGLKLLSNRINDVVKDGIGFWKDTAYWLFVQKKINNAILGLMDKKDKLHIFQFLINVPNKNFELDGTGLRNDLSAQYINNSWNIFAELTYNFTLNKWQGVHVQDNHLHIDEDGLLGDKNYCRIQLPSLSQIQQALINPNPTFTLNVTQIHKSINYTNTVWVCIPGVQSLDDVLF